MRLIETDLVKNIFLNPLKSEVDKLCIVAGYATPNMSSWLIKNLSDRIKNKIEIELLVGMVAYDGISISVHEGFCELQKERIFDKRITFTCSYIFDLPPVHSNLYIWLKNEQPIKAFVGSASFTQPSFGKDRCELMTECDPQEAIQYFDRLVERSIYCNHGEIEDNIILYPTHPILDKENNPTRGLSGEHLSTVTLSLLSRTGNTGRKSGLNWGQRGRRNKNEAYISLPASVAKSGFFPLNKQHFTATTDDHHQLIFRVEQQNDKAITTPLSNALLGEYFRNRLGLANGEYVTKQHLEDYGRTDVTFYKLDDEQFYMDFSV